MSGVKTLKTVSNFFGCIFWILIMLWCFFGKTPIFNQPSILKVYLSEVSFIFADPELWWVILFSFVFYLACLQYFISFQNRSLFWTKSNPHAWSWGGILFGISHLYFGDPSEDYYQLYLMTGCLVLGIGTSFWINVGGKNGPESTYLKILIFFLICFDLGMLVKAQPLVGFQYREQQRWVGLWDNPNTFGMLMGVGAALAIGAAVKSFKFKVQSGRHLTPALSTNEAEREGRAGNIEQPTSNAEHRRWVFRACAFIMVLFFITATGVMLFGLVKSYSRGAWLGAGIGIGFLIWSWRHGNARLTPALSPRPTGGEGEELSQGSFISRFKRNRLSVCMVLVAILVLAVWNFRHTNHSTARRAFSVANANDFSWRKRVAAYEGSLQMIADKPWFGFGWNQPEPIYDRFYRAPKVDEGMAIQMNDYFTLGTTLGIPALGCFIAYLWLSLTRNGERGTRKEHKSEHRTSGGNAECGMRSAEIGESSGVHRTSNIEHPTSRGNAEWGTGNAEIGEKIPSSEFRVPSSEDWGAHAPRVLCSAPSRNTSTTHSQTETEEEPVRGAQTGTAGAAVVPLNAMSEEEWLRMTCRAGAIVLLVGFFFDGGLFKLATGATFWILLELGSERNGVQRLKSKVQSSGLQVQPTS